MAEEQPIGVARYAVDIGGKTVGFVKKFEMPEIKAEIATHDLSTFVDQAKHITTMEFGECSIEMGLADTDHLYKWINAAFQRQYMRQDVGVDIGDFDFNTTASWDFDRCLITEVGIPALDASSKDPAYLTVKFKPEMVTPRGGGGKMDGVAKAEVRDWHLSNWRMTLDLGGGLPATKVTKVGQFTFTVETFQDRVGEQRLPLIYPGACKISDLDVTVILYPQQYEAWRNWINKYVVYGNSDNTQHGTALLEFLAPDNTKVVASMNFEGVGVSSMKHSALESNKAEKATIDLKLFIENCKFNYGG